MSARRWLSDNTAASVGTSAAAGLMEMIYAACANTGSLQLGQLVDDVGCTIGQTAAAAERERAAGNGRAERAWVFDLSQLLYCFSELHDSLATPSLAAEHSIADSSVSLRQALTAVRQLLLSFPGNSRQPALQSALYAHIMFAQALVSTGGRITRAACRVLPPAVLQHVLHAALAAAADISDADAPNITAVLPQSQFLLAISILLREAAHSTSMTSWPPQWAGCIAKALDCCTWQLDHKGAFEEGQHARAQRAWQARHHRCHFLQCMHQADRCCNDHPGPGTRRWQHTFGRKGFIALGFAQCVLLPARHHHARHHAVWREQR